MKNRNSLKMLFILRTALPRVKINWNCVKSCSSAPNLKPEENGQLSSKSIMNMDTPPVLFVSKYKKIVETAAEPITKTVSEAVPSDFLDWTPRSFNGKKVQLLLRAIKDTKSYEDLLLRINLKSSDSYLGEGNLSSRKTSKVDETDESTNSSFDPDDNVPEYTSISLDWKKLPSYYMMLSKFRLSMLVAISSTGGYCLAPMPFDIYGLIISTIGVSLLSASANSINQFLEVPFDSQMNRTRNRVLVRGLLSPKHVLGFATVTAISGTVILVSFSNTLAASLGLLNLFLYTCVYTPLKRVSILNTWIGSIVGAIPPLIGWAAASGSLTPGAFVLAGILYAWQFPHFNSLSWNLRPDYSKAGYRMTAVTDPDLCKRVALRYSLGCIGICSVVAPALDLTTMAFAVNGDSSTSRALFRFTLVHLPTLMLLMFISKK